MHAVSACIIRLRNKLFLLVYLYYWSKLNNSLIQRVCREEKKEKERGTEKMENTYKSHNLLRTDFSILDVQLAHTKQHAMPLRSYFLNPYSGEENDPPKK